MIELTRNKLYNHWMISLKAVTIIVAATSNKHDNCQIRYNNATPHCFYILGKKGRIEDKGKAAVASG